MSYTEEQIITIADDTARSAADRIMALVNIGVDELKLQQGIVSHIVGNNYTVKYTNNAALGGAEFRTGNTYCSITLSLQEQRVLPVKHFAVSEHFRHPAYVEFKLEAYIGTPINVNGRRYGTLNFTDLEPHTDEFTKHDQVLVITLADAIGQVLAEDVIEG